MESDGSAATAGERHRTRRQAVGFPPKIEFRTLTRRLAQEMLSRAFARSLCRVRGRRDTSSRNRT
jgi:hypothetical protein